jgi:hypothetical protein
MNDSIIKIDISYFQDRYNNIVDIPENIKNKVEELNNNYGCFKSYYDPKMIWVKKNFNKKEKLVPSKSRFHIIIPDFTDKSLLKRKLIGLLNKITTKNKNTIYENIKEIIDSNNNDEIFEIIWEYLTLNENSLYTNILTFFNKSILDKNIDNKWNKYIELKEWDPPNTIYANNILLLNDEYDLYCDYIKWKKKINNVNNLWIKFKYEDIDTLLKVLFDRTINILNDNKEYKHIIDIFLDQLFKILSITKTVEIINKIKDIDISKFNNSTKFLIYNILDLEK